MRRQHFVLAMIILAVLSARVLGQQRWPWSNDRSGDEESQNVAGQFDYYALVLSWSPTYCSDEGQDDDSQCNRRDGRRYSFVLHGLWPQYERGYPSACPLPRRPFVPEPLINSMLDIMPSRGLVIHEYRTHGTCSGLDPVKYFATARQLFEGITIPARFRNPFESQFVAPGDIRTEFLRANPSFSADMMTVVCGGAGGGLKEVRFCLSKDGQPRACGENETRRPLCSTDRVFIPPTRSTARDDASGSQSAPVESNQDSPLPGPRTDNGRRNP
jgi:ribonuclease T2